MSNKSFSASAWDAAHFARTEEYVHQLNMLYRAYCTEFARLGARLTPDPTKPFSFDDFPVTAARANALLSRMAEHVQALVTGGQESAWNLGNLKNDALVRSVLDTTKLPADTLATFMPRNLEALSAFQNRKVNGLGLSDRVWKQTQQFKTEMEMGLDAGLGRGKSASQLSRDLRENLNDPERLFRRVRAKHGSLALSKAAQAYHPGQGTYRSSYKNAMRLTRTEINMSYREADHARWSQFDFVVGIEVRRSNNTTVGCDVCEKLKGRYPKTFKFVGWHPNCRCHAISILASPEELRKLNRMVLSGEDTEEFSSQNEVSDTPENFRQWVTDNQDRLVKAKALPLFLSDNLPPGVSLIDGLSQMGNGPFPLVPEGLTLYESALGVQVDRRVFAILPRGVAFSTDAGSGAFFSPTNQQVNTPIDSRAQRSPWYAEAVVYHEFGHAVDVLRELQSRPEVGKLMEKYRKAFSAKGEARYAEYTRLLYPIHIKAKAAGEYDVENQSSAALDTLMALNVRYGAGRAESYYHRKGYPEAEFIAHSFSNYFKGNPVFEKSMPDLYRDMRKMVEKWVREFTKP